MAEGDARAFLDRLMNDATMRAQFRATGANTIPMILDFATMKGFTFTPEDLRAALKNAPDHFIVDQIADVLKVPRARATGSV